MNYDTALGFAMGLVVSLIALLWWHDVRNGGES